MEKGILTIAIGKKYITQAKYLSLSCKLNSPHTLRAVITNFPDKLKDYYDYIIPFNKNDDPFSIKTRLYEFSPFNKTCFLDADSLVINSIDSYFEYLEKDYYVYNGQKFITGEWYFNIDEIIKRFNLNWIPVFNSGMILFTKDERTKKIFETAYYYFKNFGNENINIPFFRGNSFSDEPALSLSLALHIKEPIDDFGRFSRTLIKAKKIHVNVIKRIAFYYKDDIMRHPLVVHFCGRRGGLYYLREKIRLLFHFFINT